MNDEEIVILDNVDPLNISTNFGWVKDNPDDRDYTFSLESYSDVPTFFSLKGDMPPVLNQGDLGSCTANGICNYLRKLEMLEGIDMEDGICQPRSRLFVYYNERAMEGTVNTDSGAQIRDGIKSINTQGACFESDWPYDISKFTDKPPPNCYSIASQHKTVTYQRVNQTETDLKQVLSSGLPVVFGFTVFNTIRNPTVTSSGVIPNPTQNAKQVGGHCVLLTGYNDNRRLFQIQNSWGTDWGDSGFGYMSYDYILDPNLASDFWMITKTE